VISKRAGLKENVATVECGITDPGAELPLATRGASALFVPPGKCKSRNAGLVVDRNNQTDSCLT